VRRRPGRSKSYRGFYGSVEKEGTTLVPADRRIEAVEKRRERSLDVVGNTLVTYPTFARYMHIPDPPQTPQILSGSYGCLNLTLLVTAVVVAMFKDLIVALQGVQD
jgi:hypothetical protein